MCTCRSQNSRPPCLSPSSFSEPHLTSTLTSLFNSSTEQRPNRELRKENHFCQEMIPAFVSTSFAVGVTSPWATSGLRHLSVRGGPSPSRFQVAPRVRVARWLALSSPPPPSDSDRSDDGSRDSEFNQPSSPSGRSDDGSRDAEFNVDISGEETEDGNELFQFVKHIPPPEMVKKFTEAAPTVVQNAIRETLVSMLGSLPPLAFSTNVSTMSSNLVQLFHSSLVTGYMFRNATYRLELTRSLDWSGLKALPSTDDKPEIKGGVAIFKQGNGSTVEVPVDEYIDELRQTVQNLQGELHRERKGGNELLSFISTMEKDNLEALTKNAGEEVVDAMKKVCAAVTLSQGISTDQESLVQASAPELGQLLFYLMVSGFFLREAEVHLDLQRKLGGDTSSLKNLLGGGPDNPTEPEQPQTPGQP